MEIPALETTTFSGSLIDRLHPRQGEMTKSVITTDLEKRQPANMFSEQSKSGLVVPNKDNRRWVYCHPSLSFGSYGLLGPNSSALLTNQAKYRKLERITDVCHTQIPLSSSLKGSDLGFVRRHCTLACAYSGRPGVSTSSHWELFRHRCQPEPSRDAYSSLRKNVLNSITSLTFKYPDPRVSAIAPNPQVHEAPSSSTSAMPM